MINLIMLLFFLFIYFVSILFNFFDILYYGVAFQVITGIISYYVGIKLFNHFDFKVNKFIKFSFLLGICFVFSGSIELIEYILDYLLNNNLQLKEQVDDTMIDIIITFFSFMTCYTMNKGGKK